MAASQHTVGGRKQGKKTSPGNVQHKIKLFKRRRRKSVNNIYFPENPTSNSTGECKVYFYQIFTSCPVPTCSFLLNLLFLSLSSCFLSSLALSNPLSHIQTDIPSSFVALICRSLFTSPSPTSVSFRSAWMCFRSQTPHELWSPYWDINRGWGGGALRRTPRRAKGGK